MLFNWFDHPLIEGWLEAQPRAELHREHAPPANNRRLERLEVSVIEPLPDATREAIEVAPVHPLHEPAPTRDHHSGRWGFVLVRPRQDRTREVLDGRLGRWASHQKNIVAHYAP